MRSKPIIISEKAFDDLIDYRDFVKVNCSMMDKIKSLGKNVGLNFEGFFIPGNDRIIIFATNDKGIRYEFLHIGKGGFRPLDGRDVKEVERILWINRSRKNLILYYKEMREKRLDWQKKGKQKELDELAYITCQYKRTFQALHRMLGGGSGKTNIPYGRSVRRNPNHVGT